VLGPTLRFKGELHAGTKNCWIGARSKARSLTRSESPSVARYRQGEYPGAQTIVIEAPSRATCRPRNRCRSRRRAPQGNVQAPSVSIIEGAPIQRWRSHGYREARCRSQHQQPYGRFQGQAVPNSLRRPAKDPHMSVFKNQVIGYRRLRSVGLYRPRPNLALRLSRVLQRGAGSGRRRVSERSGKVSVLGKTLVSRASSPLTKT